MVDMVDKCHYLFLFLNDLLMFFSGGNPVMRGLTAKSVHRLENVAWLAYHSIFSHISSSDCPKKLLPVTLLGLLILKDF